jgi:transposase InsO family protein
MLKKNGVFGLLTIPRNLKQCKACILGKHIKYPFHHSTLRALRKIYLIHSDLCGPMLVAFSFGYKYTMTFIDDYINMCCSYFLKHKYQAFETFKNFHLWIENEAQYSINTLRTDNGGKYNTNEFENYIEQHEIKHQTKNPYNPHQNGVVERMNMSLLNMVHSMLFFKSVKLMFWANVVLL